MQSHSCLYIHPWSARCQTIAALGVAKLGITGNLKDRIIFEVLNDQNIF